MQISLTPELERAVQAKVASGLYRDEADVLRAALQWFLLDEGEPWTQDSLRAAVVAGAEEAERGEFVSETMDEIIAGLEKRHSKPL